MERHGRPLHRGLAGQARGHCHGEAPRRPRAAHLRGRLGRAAARRGRLPREVRPQRDLRPVPAPSPPQEPPLENPTVTPIPGDLCYFTFAGTELGTTSYGYDREVRTRRTTVVDLALFYERNNLLLNGDVGWVPGIVWGTGGRGPGRDGRGLQRPVAGRGRWGRRSASAGRRRSAAPPGAGGAGMLGRPRLVQRVRRPQHQRVRVPRRRPAARPTGSPSSSTPTGTVAAGCCVRLKGYVNGVHPVQRRCPEPAGHLHPRLERRDRQRRA